MRTVAASLTCAALIAVTMEPTTTAAHAHRAATPIAAVAGATEAARPMTGSAHATIPQEPWRPPLGGDSLDIVELYSLPDGPYRAGHRGIDLRATIGEAVHSPAPGTVSFVGNVVDRAVLSVRVDERTVLSVEPVAATVRAGQRVAAGEVLGVISGGGHCGSTCMHLGVRIDGEYVNPLRFMRPKPVLLPWEDPQHPRHARGWAWR